VIRNVSLAALLVMAPTGLAREPDASPIPLWSEKVSRGLASAPIPIGETVWVPRPKGGVEIRSIANGDRLFRFGGKSDMRVLDEVSDTLVFVKERSGFHVLFVRHTPLSVIGEIALREPILDIDSYGGITAFIRTGSDVGMVDCDGVTRLGRIRLPGPGWCRVAVIPHAAHGALLFLSKRDGTSVVATSEGILGDIGPFAGGILEALPCREGALIFGAEGQICRLGPDLLSLWEVDLKSGLHAPPLHVDGTIWVALRDRRVMSLEPDDGSILSVFSVPSQVKNAMMAFQGNLVWCDVQGHIMAVDAEDGAVIWRFELDHPAVGVAVGKNRLVVATEEGRLCCFDTRSLPTDVEGRWIP
jgi:hypothetical protein